MSQLSKIQTSDAPAALGPYSQAAAVDMQQGQLLFVSGQLPLDLHTGKLLEGDLVEMTHLVIQHIRNILEAAGSDLTHVIRTDVFLKDLADFTTFNNAYQMHFPGPVFPALQTIQAAKLPLDSPLEISCIALIPFKDQ